ncbi:hypothetical protein F441_20420 [Phytophthora nicotianae CJ01A1]|uniref:Uncharacterized protein n=1 Tax=Phytophthora nicotianae CJ01A1 TaxID=1317063 RepID=W2VW49_PHYNI|nr:hypothetical protein F441_20420 [Phytophthora nicotianae CJ01A1]
MRKELHIKSRGVSDADIKRVKEEVMTNGCVNQQIGSWTSRSVAANTSDGVAEVEAEKTLRVGVKGSVLCDVTEARLIRRSLCWRMEHCKCVS